VAKKAKAGKDRGTLGDIAEGLGTLLGNAEKQWRAWQGPRDAVVKAVTDVRDRAAALLSEMGAAAEAAAKGSKKGKKKDKKNKKGKKDKKGKKAKAERAEAEKARAEHAAKAVTVEKPAAKDEGKAAKKAAKKAGKKAGRKKRVMRAKAAAPAPPQPAEAPVGSEAGDTSEF
jgi:hypothetical protein